MVNSLVRKVGAELIATFGFITAGCAAIIVSHLGALPPIGVAVTFGLAMAVMISAIGHISGGHVNPAVSIALAITRHLSWLELPFYLLGQFLGSILAALTLWWIFGQKAVTLAVNSPGPHVGVWQAAGIEGILTAILMFVIISVATDTQSIGKLAPFAVGTTILVDMLWGGSLSGASMNPARSFGPALIARDWTNLWVYFVGPIVGALVGAIAYQLIREPAATTQSERTSITTTAVSKASFQRRQNAMRR